MLLIPGPATMIPPCCLRMQAKINTMTTYKLLGQHDIQQKIDLIMLMMHQEAHCMQFKMRETIIYIYKKKW